MKNLKSSFPLLLLLTLVQTIFLSDAARIPDQYALHEKTERQETMNTMGTLVSSLPSMSTMTTIFPVPSMIVASHSIPPCSPGASMNIDINSPMSSIPPRGSLELSMLDTIVPPFDTTTAMGSPQASTSMTMSLQIPSEIPSVHCTSPSGDSSSQTMAPIKSTNMEQPINSVMSPTESPKQSIVASIAPSVPTMTSSSTSDASVSTAEVPMTSTESPVQSPMQATASSMVSAPITETLQPVMSMGALMPDMLLPIRSPDETTRPELNSPIGAMTAMESPGNVIPMTSPMPSRSSGPTLTCSSELSADRYVMCGKHHREEFSTIYGDMRFRLVVNYGRFEVILDSTKRNIRKFGMAVTGSLSDSPPPIELENYEPSRTKQADYVGQKSVEDLAIGSDVRKCCGVDAATVWFRFEICRSFSSDECEIITRAALFDIRCRPICRGLLRGFDKTMNYTTKMMSFENDVKCPTCNPPRFRNIVNLAGSDDSLF